MYQKSKAKKILSDKTKIDDIVHIAVNNMASIVGSTLGPGGRGVLIERDGQAPLVTKDGVTVARSLGVGDSEANVIIEAAKEICLNTAKEAGDGTTTAIVLADAIIKAGHKFLKENTKHNPQRLVNHLKKIYYLVICSYLKKNAIMSLSESDLIDVATISANGDREIANIVVKAVMSAGDDGTVLIEESQGNDTRVESIDGYIVTSGLKDHGQIGPIFINDQGGQQASMDNGCVMLYDGSMNDLKPLSCLQGALEGSTVYGKPIIVFAHEFSDSVYDKLAKQSKSGIMVIPVKTPRSGMPNSRSMFLKDMAAYTSGTVLNPGTVDDITTDDLGEFTSAKVNMYESFILNEPDMNTINSRIEELKSISEQCHSDLDKMFIKASIGKLTGGISTIYVGGFSDLEIREKKARVEDAVEAVRSAISEGIVPGGCSIQLHLANIIAADTSFGSERFILVEALRHPFRVLLENCGESYDEIFADISKILPSEANSLPESIYNADTHSFANPFVCGVVEPAKVCRVSIGNALSVASLLMTLGGIVVVPRDPQLENQLELGKQAFKDMMSSQQDA